MSGTVVSHSAVELRIQLCKCAARRLAGSFALRAGRNSQLLFSYSMRRFECRSEDVVVGERKEA
jgi:hypothetical protein